MYKTCPKCGYQRLPTDSGSSDVCPGCGLIFSKWMRRRFKSRSTAAAPDSHRARIPALLSQFTAPLFHIEGRVDPLHFWSRLATFLLFLIWGWSFIWMEVASNDIGASFMHPINLVFHEAGHILFIPLGEFMMILGGSLFQVLMPLIVAGTFLWQQHNPFGASIGLWWAGQSMMDVAPYINDARDRQLILLGGGTGEDRPWMHDWYNLLGRLQLLEQDHRLASFVDLCGEFTMLLAMCWGGYLLYQQYQRLPR
jgi:hypothetical protein